MAWKSGQCLWRTSIWLTIPINLQSSGTDFIAKIAAVFRGSGEIPWGQEKLSVLEKTGIFQH